jgi:hypothetical protein
MQLLVVTDPAIVLFQNQHNEVSLELYLDRIQLHLIEDEINISNYIDLDGDNEGDVNRDSNRDTNRELDRRIINTTINNKMVIDENVYLLLLHSLPYTRYLSIYI